MNTPDISAEAVRLIEEFEISSAAAYNSHGGRPEWPGGASGVTIGIGFDLGYCSRVDYQRAWGNLMPTAEALERLGACIGVVGAPAGRLLPSVQDIGIPYSAAKTVYEHWTLPSTVLLTVQTFPNSVFLSPDSLGALVSLVYNRGSDISDTPRRREMHQIAAALAEPRPDKVPGLIRAMKRIWEDDNGDPLPGFAGLISRREREAELFERGLDEDTAHTWAPETDPSYLRVMADSLDEQIRAEVSRIQGAV